MYIQTIKKWPKHVHACEYMWLLLQVVIPLVWMEGHAVVLTFLSVTVLVGTQDHTVGGEVAKHSKPETCMHGSCWTHELNSCMCGSLLQGAIPPVLMEEHALFQLPRFTATVPMALQDLTARSEVHIAHTFTHYATLGPWSNQALYVTVCVLHLQPVVLLVKMEEHAVVLAFLSVTVPAGTQDLTARREVAH